MNEPHKPSPLDPRDARRLELLAGGCGLVLLGMLLPLGGVHPGAQAAGHVAVSALLFVAGSLSLACLARGGAVLRLARAGAWLTAAWVPGLLLLPARFVQVLSPHAASLKPATGWTAMSVDVYATLGAMCTWLLVMGFAVSVGAWAAMRWRSRPFLRASVVWLWVLCLLAIVHVASGATSAMGVFEVQHPSGSFFGPLVSPNHLATALLFLIPLAWHVFRQDADSVWRGLGLSAVCLGGVLLLATGSVGAWLAMGCVLLVYAPRVSTLRWALRGGVALGLALCVGAGVSAWQPTWGAHSMGGRWTQYGDTLAMALAHPWTGVGAGAYEAAFPLWDSSGRFLHHTHVHNEFLQALAELGLWGVGCVILAARSWLGVTAHKATTARLLSVALFGVALHACVDFSFKIPFIALLCAAGFALLTCGTARREQASGVRVRTLLWGLALCQLPMAAWQVRSALEVRAVDDLTTEASAQATAFLARYAPWRPERTLHEVGAAARAGDHEGALKAASALAERHRGDADVLRKVGWLHARLGSLEEAERWLIEAETRAPSDFRAALALARVARSQGDGEAAAQAYGRAIRLAPVSEDLVREAYTFLPIGGHWLEVLAEGEPHNSLLLASVLQQEDPVRAMEAFEQAVRLRPAYYADLPSRAGVWFRAGREAEAEAFLRERTEDDATGRVWLELGVVLEKTGTPQEVYAAYKESSRRGWAGANSRWVRAVRRFEGPEAAERVARQKVMEGARAPGLVLVWAELQQESGDPEGCLETLRRYLTHAPEGVESRADRLQRRCVEDTL